MTQVRALREMRTRGDHLIVFVVSLAQERGVDVSERILGWNCVARAALYFLVLGLIVITSFLTQNVAGGFMYANF